MSYLSKNVVLNEKNVELQYVIFLGVKKSGVL